jgi:uncharacterized protein (DUF1778 family)
MRQSRTKILPVRVNEDEEKKIKKRAEKRKQNVSEYMRAKALE